MSISAYFLFLKAIIVDVSSKVNNTIPSNKKHMLKNKIINKMKINNNV